MNKSTLRFAILCDSLEFPKWQAECLAELLASGLAEPVAVVTARQNAEPVSRLRRAWKNRNLILWRLFNRFYLNRFSQSTKPVDLSAALGHVPAVEECPVKVGKFGEAFTEATLNFVRESGADFILRFGFGILKGEILTCTPYGVWSFHHGDPSQFRGQPPGFWEIQSGVPVTGTILQVLSEKLDAGSVLHAGFFQTLPHSYAKSRDAIYLGATSWVRRCCAAILEHGWPLPPAEQLAPTGPIYREPRNRDMVRFLLTTATAFVRNQLNYKAYRQQWNCGMVPAPIDVVAGLQGKARQDEALKQTIWMPEAKGIFRADPFGLPAPTGDQITVFFEEYDWRDGIGRIGQCRFGSGEFGEFETIVSSPHHLSYPYVIKADEAGYIVPENSAARKLEALPIGHDGKPIELFADKYMVDSSIVYFRNKYWLFYVDDVRSKNTELYIMHADHPFGPWTSHPMNPVKSDVRSARPAGTPFVSDGKLYRPAQDCSTHYGSAVQINEVLVLTETDFREVPICRIEPDASGPYPFGLHTLSQAGNFTLIDAAKKQFSVAS